MKVHHRAWQVLTSLFLGLLVAREAVAYTAKTVHFSQAAVSVPNHHFLIHPKIRVSNSAIALENQKQDKAARLGPALEVKSKAPDLEPAPKTTVKSFKLQKRQPPAKPGLLDKVKPFLDKVKPKFDEGVEVLIRIE